MPTEPPWSQPPWNQLLWNQARRMKLDDEDFPHAPALWESNGAQFVYCSPTSVEVTDDTSSVRLFWRPSAGRFDPARCWLLDADRAWFACPADEAGAGASGAAGPDSIERDAGARRSLGEDAWHPVRDGVYRTLREVWPLLSEDEVPAAVSGVALAAWHHGHEFCSACGTPTMVDTGGWVRTCSICDTEHFPRIDPAVIVALIDSRDRLLLGGQPTWGKRRSVFAGYVMAGESLEQAVHREVAEEVGLTIDHVRYFGSQPWPFPRSLMLAFTAHVNDPDSLHIDGHEIVRADWFSRDEVRQAWADGAIDPPAPMSIARRLIEAWLAGDLS